MADKITQENLKEFFSGFDDKCVPAPDDRGNTDPIAVAWSAKDIGYGEFVFYIKDGKLRCDNEAMNKDFIKHMLCKMVDDAELDT